VVGFEPTTLRLTAAPAKLLGGSANVLVADALPLRYERNITFSRFLEKVY